MPAQKRPSPGYSLQLLASSFLLAVGFSLLSLSRWRMMGDLVQLAKVPMIGYHCLRTIIDMKHLSLYIGLIFLVIGFYITVDVHPYESLLFPLDLISIIATSIGIWSICKSVFRRSYFRRTFSAILISLCGVLAGMILLIGNSWPYGRTIIDTFYDHFLWTLLSAVIIASSYLAFYFLRSTANKVFSGVGLIWLLILIWELSMFLLFRTGSPEYSTEPKTVLPFISAICLVSFWTWIEWKHYREIHVL